MKYMDKCKVLSHIAESDVRSCWNVKDVSFCEIFLHDRDEARYTLWKALHDILFIIFDWFIM